MRIEAQIVTVDDGPPVVIGFADAPGNPRNYLLLSYDPAELHEGIYIEVNDQLRGGYDLVQRIRILDSSVVIDLTQDGEKALESGPTVSISIAASLQKNWQATKQRLASLLQRWE